MTTCHVLRRAMCKPRCHFQQVCPVSASVDGELGLLLLICVTCTGENHWEYRCLKHVHFLIFRVDSNVRFKQASNVRMSVDSRCMQLQWEELWCSCFAEVSTIGFFEYSLISPQIELWLWTQVQGAAGLQRVSWSSLKRGTTIIWTRAGSAATVDNVKNPEPERDSLRFHCGYGHLCRCTGWSLGLWVRYTTKQ